MRGDTPPFQMDVVDGKLVPASAWDAERLSTYRPRQDARGNLIAPRVSVVITQEVASWARRRYWAILGVVVKTCKLPPRVRDAQGLHDAIRKQIGFVDSHSSDGKTLTVKLRSTKTLDDQEFEAFAAEAYAELSEMTGVDVMTLGKEAPDVGRDEPKQHVPLETPPSSEGSGDDTSPRVDPAPDESAAADLQEGGAEQAEQSATAPPSPGDLIELKREAVHKLIAIATDKAVPDPKDRQQILAGAKDHWKVVLADDLAFLKGCVSTVNQVITGKLSHEKAREYLDALVK